MLEDLLPPSIKRSCKVALVVETMTDKDKDILLSAILDRESWPIKSLSRELVKRGIQLSDTPLSNHRSKACACFA